MTEIQFDTIEIAPDESKYYIAIQCRCNSAIVFGGSKDLYVVKECWYCGRKWTMVEDDHIHVVGVIGG